MKKTTIQLFDDLSGDVIPEGKGRTIEFSLDGDSYEIDLSDDNITRLYETLAPYTAVARAAGRARAARSSAGRGSSGSGLSSEQLAEVRSWAAQNGYPVSDRGRIAASIREAYEAAH